MIDDSSRRVESSRVESIDWCHHFRMEASQPKYNNTTRTTTNKKYHHQYSTVRTRTSAVKHNSNLVSSFSSTRALYRTTGTPYTAQRPIIDYEYEFEYEYEYNTRFIWFGDCDLPRRFSGCLQANCLSTYGTTTSTYFVLGPVRYS